MRDCLTSELADTKAVFVQGCGGDAKIVCRDPNSGALAFAADPESGATGGVSNWLGPHSPILRPVR